MAIWDLIADHESGTIVSERRQMTARRIMLCDNYRGALAESPQIGDSYPGWDKLTVARINVQGWGEPLNNEDGAPDYEFGRVTVEYSYPNLVTDGEAFSTSQPNVLCLEVGQGRNWSDGSPVGSTSPIVVSFYLRDLCFQTLKDQAPAVDGYSNSINASPWMDPVTKIVYPIGTVLFCGVSHTLKFDAQRNAFLYAIDWKFTVNSNGWGMFWHIPTDGSQGFWDTVDPVVYPSIDFSLLGM
jgi:hypothetical protein